MFELIQSDYIDSDTYEFILSLWGDNLFGRLSAFVGAISLIWILPIIAIYIFIGMDSDEVEKRYFSDGSVEYGPTGKTIKGDPKFAEKLIGNWIVFFPFGILYLSYVCSKFEDIVNKSDFNYALIWIIIPLAIIILSNIFFHKNHKSIPNVFNTIWLVYIMLISICVLNWVVILSGKLILYLYGLT